MPTIKPRNTRQQRVILEHLRGVTCHPTAEEVYDAVVRILPRISLATVYRNLGKLAECGDIQVLEHAGGQRRYDGNPVNHVHAKCIECGRVVDVATDPRVLADLQSLAEATVCEMKVSGFQLQFVGRCTKCFSNGAS